MTDRQKLHLFEGFGVEIEYMIVDARSLDIVPVADAVLAELAGKAGAEDAYFGETAWSNELVTHLLELKTLAPAGSFEGLAARLGEEITRVNDLLDPDRKLMPGAMHPWMDPLLETRLWPGETGAVYQSFNRVFDCRGHGWSNLQSMHLNLPFGDDAEFGRLHAAIRVLLPLIPALAASSPIVEGHPTGALDSRMQFYRMNAARVPQVAGMIIPEAAFSEAEYRGKILAPLYEAIAPHDPDGVLREEWLNARGAIARFERDAFEIRVIDSQECLSADLAIAWLLVRTLEQLVQEKNADMRELQSWRPEPLRELLLKTIVEGERTRIADPAYLSLFGWDAGPCSAAELWANIRGMLPGTDWQPEFESPLHGIFSEGPLARRIIRALGPNPSHSHIAEVYEKLCDCLARDVPFSQST